LFFGLTLLYFNILHNLVIDNFLVIISTTTVIIHHRGRCLLGWLGWHMTVPAELAAGCHPQPNTASSLL
jgi:hypothetical protein